ncbi:hypothetical protein ACEWY4_011691 [Coilia grayii]|uniref:C-C motif chemokine n=1 Tax=Coilia grayii TaxID=363190 RepID=A0ABD1JYU2_9TELE
MAAGGNVRLLCWAVLLLSLCYFARGGEQAVDCCLKVSGNKIPLKILVSYRVQDKDQGCKIDAVIFTTVKDRQLCAPPKAHWVKRRMNQLNAVMKSCQESGFMGEECKGRN